MSDIERTDRPCPVHPRCSSAARKPQVQPDPDSSTDALDPEMSYIVSRHEKVVAFYTIEAFTNGEKLSYEQAVKIGKTLEDSRRLMVHDILEHHKNSVTSG